MRKHENYPVIRQFIAGKWCNGTAKEKTKVFNPSTNAEIGEFPNASAADLDAALQSAQKGFEVWRKMDPSVRCQILQNAASLVRTRMMQIADVLTLEEGKPVYEAVGEVKKSAELIDWGAQEGRRTYGRTIPSRPGMRLSTYQVPIGPVAAFSPWNFPAISPTRKLAGALSAGCSCILKASEETPGTAIEIVQSFIDAGVPDGVINLVFGNPPQISEHLLSSPVIRKLTFTGSVPVGKNLGALAAQYMKPATLELGGHSPVIVCDDVDVTKIARATIAGKYRNAGQVCVAPTRFLVQESNFDQFVDIFSEVSKALRVRDGFDPEAEMGPLVNMKRVQVMEELVADALSAGADLVAGGERMYNTGAFYAPTILSNVPVHARIMNEEPFGPVAIINRFDTVENAIHEANRLPFGLAAYAFTDSTSRSHQISSTIESGMVAMNGMTVSFPETPFGGVKDSGFGHEGGVEGIEAYMAKRLVVEEQSAA